MEAVESPQPVTEQKSTDWTKIILAAVLGLGLLAGSAYAGYWYGAQQAKESTPIASQPTLTPTSAVENETKEWRTYTSENGYIVKYPPELKPSSFPSDDVLEFKIEDSRYEASFRITEPSGINTLDDYISEYVNRPDPSLGPKATKDCSSYIIDSVAAYRCEGWVEHPQDFYYIKTYIRLKGGTFLEIRGLSKKEFGLNLEDLKINYDQILSTFKFLD